MGWLPLLVSCMLVGCGKKSVDHGKMYNPNYIVGPVPDRVNFNILTETEKLLDSLQNNRNLWIDSLAARGEIRNNGWLNKEDFRSNRSRLSIVYYRNRQKQRMGRKDSTETLNLPCECYAFKDSVFMHTGAGFFGGLGFQIKIYGDQFYATYYIWTDDIEPYKYRPEDTTWYDAITLNSKFQYLVLDKKPSFKVGQQLSGYLTMTSNNFFEEISKNTLDTNYVEAKIHFTCKTREKPPTP